MMLSKERKEQTMPDYQKMYLTLFAATEDVLNMMDAASLSFPKAALPEKMRARLIQAQQQCEDLYVENDA